MWYPIRPLWTLANNYIASMRSTWHEEFMAFSISFSSTRYSYIWAWHDRPGWRPCWHGLSIAIYVMVSSIHENQPAWYLKITQFSWHRNIFINYHIMHDMIINENISVSRKLSDFKVSCRLIFMDWTNHNIYSYT